MSSPRKGGYTIHSHNNSKPEQAALELCKQHGSCVTDDHSLTTRSKTPERRRDSREGARHDTRGGARDGARDVVKGGARGDTGDEWNDIRTVLKKQRSIWCLVTRRNDAGNDAEMAHKTTPWDSALGGARDDIQLRYRQRPN